MWKGRVVARPRLQVSRAGWELVAPSACGASPMLPQTAMIAKSCAEVTGKRAQVGATQRGYLWRQMEERLMGPEGETNLATTSHVRMARVGGVCARCNNRHTGEALTDQAAPTSMTEKSVRRGAGWTLVRTLGRSARVDRGARFSLVTGGTRVTCHPSESEQVLRAERVGGES